jgi:hypothetical protein
MVSFVFAAAVHAQPTSYEQLVNRRNGLGADSGIYPRRYYGNPNPRGDYYYDRYTGELRRNPAVVDTRPRKVEDGERNVLVPSPPGIEDRFAVTVNAGPTQSFDATVLAIDNITATIGSPQAARVRMQIDGGDVRTMSVGGVERPVAGSAPTPVAVGDAVVVAGQMTPGRDYPYLRATQIRPLGERDRIAPALNPTIITGRIQSIDQVHIRSGAVDWISCSVRAEDRRLYDVVLGVPGSTEGVLIRPNDRISLTGNMQSFGNRARFVVADLRNSGRSTLPPEPTGRYDRADRRQFADDIVYAPRSAETPAHQIFGNPR